jgi:hypothetical protein
MTLLGTRAPQAGDTEFRGTPYRAVAFFVGGPIGLAGTLLLTIATLVTNTEESERRMWAGERAFSQSGDRCVREGGDGWMVCVCVFFLHAAAAHHPLPSLSLSLSQVVVDVHDRRLLRDKC